MITGKSNPYGYYYPTTARTRNEWTVQEWMQFDTIKPKYLYKYKAAMEAYDIKRSKLWKVLA